MAVGKNKRLAKKGASKKKTVDIMTKKEWYDIKAPSYFEHRNVGTTCVTRSAGTKLAADGLRGRVFEVSLADLNQNESTWRKMRLVCEEVQGRLVLTNFHGMDLTTDKLRSLTRKWQTLIEASADVKTTDGYVLRLFALAFTKKRQNQTKTTCYAQSSQIREIRAKMVEIMEREASTCDLKDLVGKFIPDSISSAITKACSSVYPLNNVFIRKVKVLKKPRFDISKLLEIHGDVGAAVRSDVGAKVADADVSEPAPMDSV